MGNTSGFFAAVDEHLLARARRGDRAAVEGLYRIYAAPVHKLAYRLSGSIEEAEEVVQETFLEVVRSLGSFRGEAPFGAWLRRVAVSKVLDRRRRAGVRRCEVELSGDIASVFGDGASDSAARANGARIDLERAMGDLGEISRLVLWLYHVEGMTHAEIGSLLGRSPSFSKSRLSRAHERLRRRLNDAWSHDDASDHRAIAGTSGG
jgi:RNA polymerase sigma-70 factor (ECF subfamily)